MTQARQTIFSDKNERKSSIDRCNSKVMPSTLGNCGEGATAYTIMKSIIILLLSPILDFQTAVPPPYLRRHKHTVEMLFLPSPQVAHIPPQIIAFSWSQPINHCNNIRCSTGEKHNG